MSEMVSTPKEMRQIIQRGIRAAILAAGSATKAELSERLDVSFPTISKFMAQMTKTGELLSVGLDDSSGGRRAKRYVYNRDYRLGVALFLEQSVTQYTVFNMLGEVKEEGTSAGLLQDGIEEPAKRIEALIERYPRIQALAFGVPGSVSEGRIIYIPGYDKFHQFDLQRHMEERFGIPVVVENDMNAAVLGYSNKMGFRDNGSLVYLYFGQNGPGAGIMVNGSVVRGATSFSGEVSFVPLYDKLNFQQAITDGAGRSAVADMPGGVDAVSRLVAAFAAMLNPDAVIFSRDEATDELLAAIASGSEAYMPREHLPRLAASDWKDDYVNGLKALGLHLMIAGNEDSMQR